MWDSSSLIPSTHIWMFWLHLRWEDLSVCRGESEICWVTLTFTTGFGGDNLSWSQHPLSSWLQHIKIGMLVLHLAKEIAKNCPSQTDSWANICSTPELRMAFEYFCLLWLYLIYSNCRWLMQRNGYHLLHGSAGFTYLPSVWITSSVLRVIDPWVISPKWDGTNFHQSHSQKAGTPYISRK